MHIVRRSASAERLPNLHPVFARVLSARGVQSADELENRLAQLLPPDSLKDIETAVDCLLPVVTEQQSLLVVGDFDVDGATSTALALRAFRAFGAQHVSYLVPNRFEHGYGLSPELVFLAQEQRPDVLLTVDNGIAAVDGVAAAKALGIKVVVTDHHLAAEQLPDADAIVNPNQPGCEFASKAACGCAVLFYVLMALRKRLQAQGWPNDVNLAQWLDLVALATVADVVPLDRNNRILVEQGLRRIRRGHVQPGIKALLEVAGRQPQRLASADLGFVLGPRINAAGRLDDISLGIECLLSDDAATARSLAQQLDEMNRSRRDIEQGMQQEAERYLAAIDTESQSLPAGVCLYQSDWHQGVIGILASRIKERAHRPVIILADDDSGVLKGSARSLPGLHMRDLLDELDKRWPGLLIKFGGHAMAAGMTIKRAGLETFQQAFVQLCSEHLTEEDLQRVWQSDGELSAADFTLELAQQLRWGMPWGQSFAEPIFDGEFNVVQQRVVGEKHLKLVLAGDNSQQLLDAIWFNGDLTLQPLQGRVKAVFSLDVNEWQGRRQLQLLVRHLQPLG
ncbi:single-stranded-DNA-specific exonuclease RecJ [Bacterioplanes sanyensis]|uniref:Single-stranded-DNA-specific exonuclease RecJ n=1 Tax=Bacterioplanes sanyensis TaxID=1249553 RepID=A0A222FPJ6_9GAMM|nr:single-stranded-DNA-specific exonuclease RecJ [Bacterioplanes sanyensis]ASP40321.1 single-stranded-DNA-specific exonuclease RecJ [Bacterioplanes sanyensis]